MQIPRPPRLVAALAAAVLVLPAWAQPPPGLPDLPPANPIHIQGRPAFPVGLYGYPRHPEGRDIFKAMADAGFDLYLMSPETPREQLDAAHAAGVRVMIVVGDLLNLTGTHEQIASKKKALAEKIGPESVPYRHPAVVALEGPDEPLWNVKYGPQSKHLPPEMATWARPPAMREEIYALFRGLRDGYAEVRRLCGDRYTVWINFAPRGDENELRWFTDLPAAGGFPTDGRRTADAFGTDIYPVPDGTGNNGWIRGRLVPSPAAVGAFAERLRRAVHPYPTYMVLQGCGIDEYTPAAVAEGRTLRRPTFEETQFMAFDAIVHGTGGILIWGATYVDDGSLFWRHTARAYRHVRALAPMLADGATWPVALPGMPQVSALGKLWNGERYVIVTNNAPHNVFGWVAVPGWKGDRAYSLLDGRSVPVDEGVLRGTLPPLGVAVYTDGTSLFRSFGRPSPESAGPRPMRLLFGLPLDADPFRGKAPAEVAAALKEAGVDGIVAAPHEPALVAALRAAGIRAYAETSCFSGTATWQTHPKTRPVTAAGEPYPEDGGYGGICLSQEDYQQDLLARIDKLLDEAPWDGLWLDFIRWPGKWEVKEPRMDAVCFCDTCLARFAEDRGVHYPKDLAGTKAKAAWILAHHGAAWTEWKCDRVADAVARIRERLKAKRGADAILGIFAVPLRQSDYDGAIRRVYGQDWAKLSPLVDVFSPMVYHGLSGRPVEWIAEVSADVAQRSRREVWPIVQAINDPAPAIPAAEFEQALRQGLRAPATGVMPFHAEAAAKNGKWEALKRVYREAGSGGAREAR